MIYGPNNGGTKSFKSKKKKVLRRIQNVGFRKIEWVKGKLF